MAAERARHVVLIGLEVRDDAGYGRYRAGMTPILETYGGSFGCDFVIARVLKGPSDRLNRVFTIVFQTARRRPSSSPTRTIARFAPSTSIEPSGPGSCWASSRKKLAS